MARFTLTIDTGNAAFHSQYDGAEDPGPELAAILRKTAAKVADGSREGKVYDVNGNRVGEYQLGEDPPAGRATRGAIQTGAGHIHPESLRTLRQLVELHGALRIRQALEGIRG